MRDGYLVIPNAIDPIIHEAFAQDLDAMFARTPHGRGGFYGETTKRFGRLLYRSRHARHFACHPLMRRIVEAVLLNKDCNRILLNLTQAIEIHPGAPLQCPHRDHDMFGGEKGGAEYMLNIMWPIDDFTADNGATRIWPGSNHGDMADFLLPEEASIPVIAPRGSAILFLGSTVHAGSANRSRRARRGAIFSYCQGWLRPWENPWLAYPPRIARRFDREVQELIGYSQHLPSLGNFEGKCPSVLLEEPDADHLGFVDSLRPDQAELVREYQRLHSARSAA